MLSFTDVRVLVARHESPDSLSEAGVYYTGIFDYLFSNRYFDFTITRNVLIKHFIPMWRWYKMFPLWWTIEKMAPHG